MTYQFRLREEPFDFSYEFDDYENGLLESDSEFADFEEGKEIRLRPRIAGPVSRGRPPPRHPRPLRTIFRPWRVSAGVIHEPPICICPEQTCPQHGSEYIRWVQSTLNRVLGMRLPLNGVLTPATRSAIRGFQEREKLPVTGIVGPDTERALIAARSGQSLGAADTKPAEPGMTEPPEPAVTPPEPGMTEPAEPVPTSPAAEFDFEWETRAPLRRRPVVVGDGPGVCTCPEPRCTAHGMEQFAESGDGAGEADGFETELLAELVDLDFNEKFDDGTSPLAPESADAVERFIGSEHRLIGDHAIGKIPTTIVYDEKGTTLTFGEVIALAGDLFDDYYQMKELARTPAGRATLRWALWYATDEKPATEPSGISAAIKDNVKENYLALAGKNISHFSAGGTSWQTYFKWHSKAMVYALDAGIDSSERLWREALSTEAFALHFLTDSFSSGHIRTPRAEMQEWYEKNYPNAVSQFVSRFGSFMYAELKKRNRELRYPGALPFIHFLPKYFTEKSATKGLRTEIKKFSLDDPIALAMHDLDNDNGLPVISAVDPSGKPVKGGYRWHAFGDGKLGVSSPDSKRPETQNMVVSAVKASMKELSLIRTAGAKNRGRQLTTPQRSDVMKKALGIKPGLWSKVAAGAYLPKEDKSRSTKPLEWRWGRLDPQVYDRVNKAIATTFAKAFFEKAAAEKKKGPTTALGVIKIGGAGGALYAFAKMLETKGIKFFEEFLGKAR